MMSINVFEYKRIFSRSSHKAPAPGALRRPLSSPHVAAAPAAAPAPLRRVASGAGAPPERRAAAETVRAGVKVETYATQARPASSPNYWSRRPQELTMAITFGSAPKIMNC